MNQPKKKKCSQQLKTELRDEKIRVARTSNPTPSLTLNQGKKGGLEAEMVRTHTSKSSWQVLQTRRPRGSKPRRLTPYATCPGLGPIWCVLSISDHMGGPCQSLVGGRRLTVGK